MNLLRPLTFQGGWSVSPVVAEKNDESYRNGIIAGFEQLPAGEDTLTFAEQIKALPKSVQIDYRLLQGDDDYVDISLRSGVDGEIQSKTLNRPLSLKNWLLGKEGKDGKERLKERFQDLEEFLPEVIKKAKEMAEKYRAQ